ncbi:hypothetical protein LCGC14_1116540 [marine sediment metagenome]|uniref:Uncharacterized protein n=1 Tax=marine sediment metagenome TaxID=412755 RepID=A0A0F9M527_9ZZZZ
MDTWTDEQLKAYRDCLEAESDLMHASERRQQEWAVLRRDVQIQVFHGHWPGKIYWASDLERMWEEGKDNPVFLAICEAIGYPEHMQPEPPWRKVVRRVLGRRNRETAEIKRLLRDLAKKDEPEGKGLAERYTKEI